MPVIKLLRSRRYKTYMYVNTDHIIHFQTSHNEQGYEDGTNIYMTERFIEHTCLTTDEVFDVINGKGVQNGN